MMNRDRKDYVLVVNSIDLTNNKYVFKEYRIIGNSERYPDNDTVDINRLMNLLRFDELKQNRLVIDIVSCIIPVVTGNTITAKVLWDTPGIEGNVQESKPIFKSNSTKKSIFGFDKKSSI